MREAPNNLRPTISSRAGWIGLALLGLIVAAAVSVAASRISSQQIGITSEPLTAGRELAPAAATAQHHTPAAGSGQSGGGAGAQGGGSHPAGTTTSSQSSPPPAAGSTGEPESPGVETGETGEGSGVDADD